MIAFVSPIQFTHFSGWMVLGVWVALSIPVLLLGMRSLAGLGPTRKWTSIIVRLLLLLALVCLLAGLTFNRVAKDVQVVVVRDMSESTQQVRQFPGKTLDDSINDYLKTAVDPDKTADPTAKKKPTDRIGIISFANRAYVDMVPDTALTLDARAIRENGTGTDVSAALQLALATLNKDAMPRLLLIWDGNQTTGDIEAAIAAANSANVPIDVMPLSYNIQHEIMIDRFLAPTSRRENEPFTIDVVLKNTNKSPTPGTLRVWLNNFPFDLDPNTPGVQQARKINVQAGQHVEHIQVPALAEAGVHQFRASFEADDAGQASGITTPGVPAPQKIVTDTLAQNNTASAFTFVQGKGKVLYIDNIDQVMSPGGGKFLADALARTGITLDEQRRKVADFPTSAVELQNYDAVILSNVPRGPGGLSDAQGDALANYVHELGGGLIVVGGPDALGAGGWQSTKLEKVLPVDMEVPAKRTIPKGALVLVMHACEMPDGNYWGMQCALKAVEVLNSRDDIGVVLYGWNNGGSGWEYPLSPKGDGSKVNSAIKNMSMGDMPSFQDSVNTALNGDGTVPGLLGSNARNKHIIAISDGDPAPPSQALIDAAVKNKISISTVSVYPHDLSVKGLPPTMRQMADQTKGRAYGPINGNFTQLPQIFIKEASIVRRSLIQEDKDKGFQVHLKSTSSDVLKGIDQVPGLVYGMVLCSKKASPQVEMPLTAGPENDPLLAHWQSGLGRSAVFTADAHNNWGRPWLASNIYDKFWLQMIRTVSRPAESADFETTVTNSGGRGKIIVEAVNKNNQFRNGLAIIGKVLGPDNEPIDVRLVQTGPGTYEGEFAAQDAGSYVVGLTYTGQDKQSGMIRSGTVVNTSPELRDLRSNDMVLKQIADRTGGRVLKAWDGPGAALFDRTGLIPRVSPMPVWDYLLPIVIGLLILDVGIRRIAWDWASIQRAIATSKGFVRSYTTTRKVETTQSLDALRKIRQEGATAQTPPTTTTPPPINPKMKFEAKSDTGGNITDVVGGATNKPIPKAPPEKKPGSTQGPATDTTGSLLEAKRRAQQKMKDQENNNS